MITEVILDTSPLGLLSNRAGKSQEIDECHQWFDTLRQAGVKFYMPEIADYEVRRELVRSKQTAGISRLDRLKIQIIYLPIHSDAMLLAADLCAQVRNAGIATADKHALDGDVILCAQALSLGLATAEFVIATSNVKHLSRFVPAEEWANIQP